MYIEIATRFLVVAAVLVVLTASAPATDLFTRNDFPLYDTSQAYSRSSWWPDVGIDSAGNLYQVNYVMLDANGGPPANLSRLNKFDPSGSQLLAASVLLPYVGPGDTVYGPTGWHPIYCNDGGQTVVTYSNTRILGFAEGASVLPLAEPLCFNCEPELSGMEQSLANGAINNSGVTAACWYATRDFLEDTVVIRLYYPEPDSLSDPVFPNDETYAPMPGFAEVRQVFREPVMGIANDGSFAVSWICRDYLEGYLRVLYVVYDANGVAQTPVQLAECEGFDPFDPQRCPTNWPNTVSMAMEPDGDFYLVWFGALHNHLPGYEAAWHFWIRGFNADGSPKYDPIIINDEDTLYNLNTLVYPQIACDDQGNVLVAWADSRLHPETSFSRLYYDVYLQRIDPEGNLIGHNMRMNDAPGNSGMQGSHFGLDLNNEGQAVVVWASVFDTYNIYGQLMPLEAVGAFVPGDINNDLAATVSDLTTLVSYLFGGDRGYFWPRDIIDLNGDGSNGNVSDLTYLVDYLFRGGPEPATPDPGIRPPIRPPSLDKGNVSSEPEIAQPGPIEWMTGRTPAPR